MFCHSLQIPVGAACWTGQQNYGFIQDWLRWVCKHFWRIKKERACEMSVSWMNSADGSLQVTECGAEQDCVRGRERTYCKDARGPAPRPQRCSQDGPSKRRIQISPATHEVGVSFTEVAVGLHHRNLPSPQTLYVSASHQNHPKRPSVWLECYPGNWLGFSEQDTKGHSLVTSKRRGRHMEHF